jgi:hypothetical protein
MSPEYASSCIMRRRTENNEILQQFSGFMLQLLQPTYLGLQKKKLNSSK